MDIQFFHNHSEHNPRAEEYIAAKIDKLERYLNNVLKAEVEIEKDKKGKYRVEVMVRTPYKLYRAEDYGDTPVEAADLVEGILKLQMKKDKEKMITLKRRGATSLKKKLALDSKARFRAK